MQTLCLSTPLWRTNYGLRVGLLSIILMTVLGLSSFGTSPIRAAGMQQPPTVLTPTLVVGSVDVLIGDSVSIPITLSDVPSGMGGYSIELTLDGPAVAEVVDVVYPGFGLTDTTWVSGSHVTLQVVDLNEIVSSGDTDITLATVVVTGTDVGVSPVSVSVLALDDDDGFAVAATVQNGSVDVTNAAPVVDAGQDMEAQVGVAIVSVGSYDDSTGTTWTGTVDYGDGSGLQPLVLNGDQIDLSHTYTEDGVYTIAATVTDNFGAAGMDSAQVTVVTPTLAVGSADVSTGDSVSIPITLSDAPNGVGGYSIEITLDGPAVAEITDIGYPDFGLTDTIWVSGTHVTVQVVDLNELVNPGDSDITLANVVITGTDVGASSVSVSVTALDDDNGFHMTPTVQNGSINVTNAAPAVDAGQDIVIQVGQAIVSAGSFDDSTGDAWTGTVDYGDGSGLQPLVLIGKEFELSHTYADDGVYALAVTVTDSFGASGLDSAQVTVTNVSPEVHLNGDVTIENSYNYAGSGSFDDPGSDTWTATVDYGDGAGPQQLMLSGMDFTLSHEYTNYGVYRLSVTVIDDNGASGTSSFEVEIRHVCPRLWGNTSPSIDHDGDYRCEDLNGNGRLDFTDIVDFFHNLVSADIQNNADDFDFNGNGRLDMDDVVTLFKMIVS